MYIHANDARDGLQIYAIRAFSTRAANHDK
jgi:hypothetical protein